MDYERDGKRKELTLTVGEQKQTPGLGSMGISFAMEAIPPRSFFEAITQGIKLTNDWIAQTIKGFIGIFRKADIKNVGGPVVIISMLSKGAAVNFKIFIILLAIISINLAILNLIPLPILDGGQLLFYTIEAIIGRPLPIKVREYIHIASWILVMGLVLYLSVFDIARIAHPYIEHFKQFLGFSR
jgi:regulator of sigma E protease